VLSAPPAKEKKMKIEFATVEKAEVKQPNARINNLKKKPITPGMIVIFS